MPERVPAALPENSPPRLLMVTTIAATMPFFLPFVSRLRRLGWRVDGLAAGLLDEPELAKGFNTVYDARWGRNPLDVVASTGGMRDAKRAMSSTHYDVVHVHTPIAAFATRLAARGRVRSSGTQVIYTAHGFHFYRGQLLGPRLMFTCLEKLAGRWTDWLVLINGEDLEAAQRLCIVPPERTVLIPGVGVDTTRFSLDRVGSECLKDVEEELGLRRDQRLLLTIGELNDNKRPLHVIRAFNSAFGRDSHVHLAIIGKGPLRDRCQELIAALGLQEAVSLLGWIPDVRPYIARSCATVLYSKREGLPLCALESLSMERPVVASSTRGVRDVLSSGAGWLVDVDDLDQLAHAMQEAVLDADEPGGPGTRGRIGRALVMQRFEVGTVTAAYDALYAAALVRARS